MTAQHTQGPWSVTYDTDIIGTENDPENECVGTVDVAHVYLRTVPGRTAANARLIAAAPDLLEALSLLAAGIENSVSDTYLPLKKARAAISKATGSES